VDALALLRLELDTLWVTDAAGRLVHCRTVGRERPPQLVVGACTAGVVWAVSTAVPEAVRGRVASLLADERLAEDEVGWAPAHAGALVRALSALGPLTAPHGGPSFVVADRLAAPVGFDLRSSPQTDVAALPGLPAADQALGAPWVAALVDGRVAAVCETARSAARSTEAGVWTYEPFRRRGLGAAVTAAWSALVTDRTAFYSTGWDNHASQAVARRLALRPLGHWWQLSPAPASA
jgi:hypothetical protein